MRSRKEIQEEYDEMYRVKPNRWGGLDRSNFMIKVLQDICPNPETLVDVGCGNGITLENYRRYNSTTKLYGIDPSLEGIRLAKLRVPDGIFTSDDEFEDTKVFDLVVCMGVAEHAEILSDFLKSLKAKVKEEGFCYFEVPHNLVYSKGPHTFRRPDFGSRQVEWHLSRGQWESLLLDAGFEIVETHKGRNVTWEFIWILK